MKECGGLTDFQQQQKVTIKQYKTISMLGKKSRAEE